MTQDVWVTEVIKDMLRTKIYIKENVDRKECQG